MRIAVVSLHFSPAFIGHMKAWYKLCVECGYEVKLYFSEEYEKYFKEENYIYTTNAVEIERFHPECAVVQNIGFEDVKFFKWCKKNGCYLFYILHEPYMGFTEILKESNQAPKQMIASMLNIWLCRKANRVIICSRYARENCEKYMKGILKKLDFLPLLFLDDYRPQEDTEREYFSMIGTYAISHGSDFFLEFMKEAYKRGLQLKFQVATRSNINEQLADPVFKEMEDTGVLLLQQGRPLTEKEMCDAYRRSYAVWNGYRRSTQSGVLPNAFMQGTPVIASHLSSFDEFVREGETGSFIEDMSFDETVKALNAIRENNGRINVGCREYFLKHFYYGSHVEAFKMIVSKMVTKVG